MDFLSMILESVLEFVINKIPFFEHPILRAILQILLMAVICALVICVAVGVSKLILFLRKQHCENTQFSQAVPTVTGDTDLAALNPCSYRGYYYDEETGYYYLQSRYYDPEVGRFINDL